MKSVSMFRSLVLAAVALGIAAGSAAAATTLDNLQTAFNGESNAHAKYLLFAKKAQDEGYLKVATLFKAAARAEEIHAGNHAEVIKKMGGVPKADVKAAEVKTTSENLKAAIEGETYEHDKMYTDFLKQARAEKNVRAVRTFNFARETEAGHAKLYGEALANLDGWKVAGTLYVCPECGNTVTALDFKKCAICSTKPGKFEKVS
jgi:rubrerythrin